MTWGFDDGHLSETRPEEDFAPLLKESFLFRGNEKNDKVVAVPKLTFHDRDLTQKKKKTFKR